MSILKNGGFWSLALGFFIATSSYGEDIARARVAQMPLKLRYELHLDSFEGKSFYQFMTADKGLVDTINLDYETPFELVDMKEGAYSSSYYLDHFSDKVKRKVLDRFWGDDEKKRKNLAEFTSWMKKKFGPIMTGEDFGNVIFKVDLYKPYGVRDLMMIASGAGTLVRIDKNNYYYNIGYNPSNVKRGRSFGGNMMRNADDASYPAYLGDLDQYFGDKDENNVYQSNAEVESFYRRMLEILTRSDSGKLKQLSPEAQIIMTDFITVYTAELYRYFSDLATSDSVSGNEAGKPIWANDLLEVNLISVWNDKVGLLPRFSDGELAAFESRTYKGRTSKVYGLEMWNVLWEGKEGSGLGHTRKVRSNLEVKICSAVKGMTVNTARGDLTHGFLKFTGTREDGNCYRAITKFLNSKDSNFQGKQGSVAANNFVDAVVTFLMYTHDNAELILKEIIASSKSN